MEKHRLTCVYFKNLQALHDLEFELGDKNVTAIFGKNGSGKSTILHAMACIYRAPSGTDSRTIRFPRFFKKEDHVSWIGSFFRVNYVHDGTPETTPQKSSQKSSQKVLELISVDDKITTQEMADKLEISRRAVAKTIAKLQSAGILRRVGSDKGGHWEIIPTDR